MQRNTYKSALDREKEESLKLSKGNGRWGDINIAGLPDFKNYIDIISKNITSELNKSGLNMMDMMGKDANPLAILMASPLKEATKTFVKSVLPATLKMASKELDNTISNVFATAVSALSSNKNKYGGGV